MVRVTTADELRRASGGPARFEGYLHGAAVSFYFSEVPEGSGPGLHRHPYEETFVVHGGSGTFTVDGETVEATAGTIVVVPPGAAHKFVAGPDGLRSVNIHGSERMIQEDLPDSAPSG